MSPGMAGRTPAYHCRRRGRSLRRIARWALDGPGHAAPAAGPSRVGVPVPGRGARPLGSEDLADEHIADPVWGVPAHHPGPRRLPGAAALVREGSTVRLHHGYAVAAQPAEWRDDTAEAQEGQSSSMLHFYRAALSTRRALNEDAAPGLTWLDGPEGVLAFHRGSFGCTVNLSEGPIPGDRTGAAGQRAGRRRAAAAAVGGLDLRAAGCRPGCPVHRSRKPATRRSTVGDQVHGLRNRDCGGSRGDRSRRRRCVARSGPPAASAPTSSPGQDRRDALVDGLAVSGDALDQGPGVVAHRWLGICGALGQRRQRVAPAQLGLEENVQRPLAGLAAGRHGVSRRRPPSQTRPRYSPVRVSTLTFSPVVRNSGTWICSPVSTVAGFVPPVLRSPCKPGSV